MLELVTIDYKEFKKDFYRYYKKLFPKMERKLKKELKILSKKTILKFIKIKSKEKNIGFLIYETVENNPLVLLDYFAIFKEYQNKNYGSKAFQLFKNFLKEKDYIFIEVEKEGAGETLEENRIRTRRIQFWQKFGFKKMSKDFNLFGVFYSPYVMCLNNQNYSEEKLIHYAFLLYKIIFGVKRTSRNCKIIEVG